MKKIYIIVIISLISFCSSVFAEQDELFVSRGSGGYGANFINSAVNAYGLSTGGMLTVFGNTIDTVLWNPGGLTEIEDSQVQFSYSSLSLGRVTGSVGFATLVGEDEESALGVTILNSTTGGIDSYDDNDQYIKEMSYMGNSLIMTYSKAISFIRIGANLKLLNEMIDTHFSYGGALDIGLVLLPPLPVSIGINVKNIPGFVRWNNDSKIFQVGTGYQMQLGYRTMSDNMKIGIGLSKDYGDAEHFINVGGEYAVSPLFKLRIGYFEESFSGGFGIDLGFVNIDYAYYNEEFLDMNFSSHLAALAFHF